MNIKTKFNIGDTCYFMMFDKVQKSEIKIVRVTIDENGKIEDYYVKGNPVRNEYGKFFSISELYRTKQELIESL